MVVLLRNAVSKQKSSPELSKSLLILLQGNSSESNAPVIVFYFRQLVLMSMSTLFCKVFVLMLWFPSVMMILTGNLTLQSLWDALILVSWKILIYNYVSEGMLCNSVMFTPCVHHTKFGNDHQLLTCTALSMFHWNAKNAGIEVILITRLFPTAVDLRSNQERN